MAILIAAILIVVILLMGVITFYYHSLIRRNFAIFHKEIKGKWRYALWVASVVLSISSLNFFSIAGIYLVHFLIFSLLLELVNLIMRLMGKGDKTLWKRVFCSSIIPIVLSAVVLGYGYGNIRLVVRTPYEVEAEKNISRDYKVVFLSDVHYGTILKKEELSSLVKRINQEKADIVILGGDIADEGTDKEMLDEAFSALGCIKSRFGIYYVWGNHDKQMYSKNRAYSEKEISEIIRKNGIRILEDEAEYVGDDIIIAGRDDYGAKRYKEERKTLDEILKEKDNEKYIITVDHQPVEYEEIRNKTDLIVSGHTHAGQVFPAGYFIKLMKTADLWYGHEKTGNTDAIVSSGAAGWGYPVRTQKHSEYVVIMIKR